jgi:Zn finger protein HypA/HybF involved in hydrogenase expression
MDELEMAQTVFETILAEAKRVNLRPVAATLSYGVMCTVNKEALYEAFASLCEGTICSGTRLDVNEIRVQIRCNACEAICDYDIVSPRCAKCGSHDFGFLPEPPILLEEIEFKEA